MPAAVRLRAHVSAEAVSGKGTSDAHLRDRRNMPTVTRFGTQVAVVHMMRKFATLRRRAKTAQVRSIRMTAFSVSRCTQYMWVDVLSAKKIPVMFVPNWR